MVQTAVVNDDVPKEVEVELSVRGLKGGGAGGTSCMREEDMKGWIKEDKLEKYP